MVNETQQTPPQPEDPQAPLPPQPVAPQTAKSKKGIWLVAGAIIGVLCLCSTICVAIYGTSMYKIYKERAPVEAVLDTYMNDMANKDAKSAYALFSPRVQRQVPILKIQEMLQGNNYILFEGYQSLSVSNLNISAEANTNPDHPQGIVANVQGVIKFEDDIEGGFNAILEKVDGQWMIDSMYITVPPSKFK